MKAYGVPRTLDLIYPDRGDVARYGVKSSVGRCSTRGGKARSSFKNPDSKARTRRTFKRVARAEAKAFCEE